MKNNALWQLKRDSIPDQLTNQRVTKILHHQQQENQKDTECAKGATEMPSLGVRATPAGVLQNPLP